MSRRTDNVCEFVLRDAEPEVVGAVNDKDDALRRVEILAPEIAVLLRARHVVHREHHRPVLEPLRAQTHCRLKVLHLRWGEADRPSIHVSKHHHTSRSQTLTLLQADVRPTLDLRTCCFSGLSELMIVLLPALSSPTHTTDMGLLLLPPMDATGSPPVHK